MTARPSPSAVFSAVRRPVPRPSGAGMTAPLWRWARRGGITVAGLSLLAGGAVMLVLPGPGVAVILLGLAVLASEYAWAARLLARLRQHAARLSSPLRERWRRTRRPEGYQQAPC